MLRLDVGASVLAGLVSRKENYPSRLLRIAFKHRSPHAPKVVCLLYRMLGPSCANQSSRTYPPSRLAAHAPTPALDRRHLPTVNCASPRWKSNGGTDGGVRSTQKCLPRSVRRGLRWARPREVARADSPANARLPPAAAHRRKAVPPAALPGQPARLHPASLSPRSVPAPVPALESARASPHFPPP